MPTCALVLCGASICSEPCLADFIVNFHPVPVASPELGSDGTENKTEVLVFAELNTHATIAEECKEVGTVDSLLISYNVSKVP